MVNLSDPDFGSSSDSINRSTCVGGKLSIDLIRGFYLIAYSLKSRLMTTRTITFVFIPLELRTVVEEIYREVLVPFI